MLKYYKTFISKSGDKYDTGAIKSKAKMHKALTTIADRIFKEQFTEIGGGAF
jgi:hypothetical protein